MKRSSVAINALLAAQFAIGASSLGLLALAPPATGEMLLLPMRSGVPVARLARDGDAMLLARGPADGLVVRGERGALFWPLLRQGVLTLAAPRSLCGEVR